MRNVAVGIKCQNTESSETPENPTLSQLLSPVCLNNTGEIKTQAGICISKPFTFNLIICVMCLVNKPWWIPTNSLVLKQTWAPKGSGIKGWSKAGASMGQHCWEKWHSPAAHWCLHCQAAACTSHWERGLQHHGAAGTALWEEAEEADSFFRRPRLLATRQAAGFLGQHGWLWVWVRTDMGLFSWPVFMFCSSPHKGGFLPSSRHHDVLILVPTLFSRQSPATWRLPFSLSSSTGFLPAALREVVMPSLLLLSA